MSDAEQFTAAVPERSVPTDWRGGLERMRRKAGQGRTFQWRVARCGWTALRRPRYAREKNKPEARWSLSSVALSG